MYFPYRLPKQINSNSINQIHAVAQLTFIQSAISNQPINNQNPSYMKFVKQASYQFYILTLFFPFLVHVLQVYPPLFILSKPSLVERNPVTNKATSALFSYLTANIPSFVGRGRKLGVEVIAR